MLVIALVFLIVAAGVITELMLTDGVRAGRYRNPNVASKVVRGTIYDRNGRALALEVSKNRLYVTPASVKDIDTFSQILSIHLDRTPGEITSMLGSAASRNARVLLADDVGQKTMAQINAALEKNGLAPISTEKEYMRTYPAAFHAAQLIEETEKVYDDVLSPYPGFGESITYGSDVYLELDLDIQYLLDLAVQQVYDIQSPDYAVGFVLDYKTGELLASTTYPFYDLNDSGSIPDIQRVNRTLMDSINQPGIRITNISVVDRVTVHNSPSAQVTDFELDSGFTVNDEATKAMMDEPDGMTSLMVLIPEDNHKYIVFLGSVNPRFYKVSSVMEYALQTLEQGLVSQSKI